MDNRPIGMFDSGCGGLTVLKEYMKLMPNEDFLYYGDTAHLPYGDKSPEKIIEYSEKIIEFLISKNVKLIVIACGTASANAYEHLKNKYDIEIRNIITPTAKSLKDNNIGVIATKSTIKSKAWENAILSQNPLAKVMSIACPLFVPLIEEGFLTNPACEYIVKEYIKNFENKNITSLVLGCTHYPLLKEQIQKEIGENVNLIDVGSFSANDTLEYLKLNNMLNDTNHIGTQKFYSSDDFEVFKETAKVLKFDIK